MTSKPPRVAVDARMCRKTGIGRYVRSLLNHLLLRDDELRYLVIVNPEADPTAVWDWLRPPPEALERVEICSFGKPVPIYSVQEQVWLPKVLSEKPVDLFHAPHFNVPLMAQVPLVTTIHDCIYLSHPESAPGFLGRLYARSMLKRAARRSDHIITATEASKADISERLNVDPTEITVIGHGADEMAAWVGQVRRGSCESISERVRNLPQFILSVGNHLPHKNQALLFEALAKLAGLGYPKLVLALAGPKGRHTGKLLHQAQRLGVADRVELLGDIPDKDLAWLYDNAAALVHPSLAEGFGLPVLEAMRVGCPAIVSDIPVLREVAQKGVVYCPPRDAQAFAVEISKVLLQPAHADALSKRGYQSSQRFSYARAAEQTAALYKSLLAERS